MGPGGKARNVAADLPRGRNGARNFFRLFFDFLLFLFFLYFLFLRAQGEERAVERARSFLILRADEECAVFSFTGAATLRDFYDDHGTGLDNDVIGR